MWARTVDNDENSVRLKSDLTAIAVTGDSLWESDRHVCVTMHAGLISLMSVAEVSFCA